MCEFLDRIEKNGKAEGKKEMAKNMYSKGIPIDFIAEVADVAVSVVEKWLGLTPA